MARGGDGGARGANAAQLDRSTDARATDSVPRPHGTPDGTQNENGTPGGPVGAAAGDPRDFVIVRFDWLDAERAWGWDDHRVTPRQAYELGLRFWIDDASNALLLPSSVVEDSLGIPVEVPDAGPAAV